MRWWLLAEDPRHERLALYVARALSLNDQPVKAWVAPAGRGSASAWVRKVFPLRVRETTRKRPGERVALIVLTDGDNLGVVERKRTLDDALGEAGEARRTNSEPVVVLVPTWSVETWLLDRRDESVSFKEALRRGDDVTALFEAVAERLKERHLDGAAPSLHDARVELDRLNR